MLEMLAFSACRPGAIVESGANPGTNQVFKYKDCVFSLTNGKNGAEFVLQVNIVWLKDMRQSERYMYVSNTAYSHRKLTHDSQSIPLHIIRLDYGFGTDPICLFLVMAFADGAFDDEDLSIDKLMMM